MTKKIYIMLTYILDDISDKDDMGSFHITKIEIDEKNELLTIYTRSQGDAANLRNDKILLALSQNKNVFSYLLEMDHPTEEHKHKFHPLGKPGQYENHYHLQFEKGEMSKNYEKFFIFLKQIKSMLHDDLYQGVISRNTKCISAFQFVEVSDESSFENPFDFLSVIYSDDSSFETSSDGLSANESLDEDKDTSNYEGGASSKKLSFKR
jgi:hypothetical protein